MKVSSRWLNAIFLAVQLWQACGLSVEQLCNFWPRSGYVGDPRDCQSWGYCKNNKLAARGRCHNNLYYDSQSGRCDKAHLVRCAPQYWELCAQSQSEEYFADPLDCTTYNKCDNEGNNYGQRFCAEGFVFSNRLQTCVSSGNGCPQETVSICAYMQSGTTVGDPLNCGLYLECEGGRGIRRACTGARYYNYKRDRCQPTQPKYCPPDGSSYKPVKYPPPSVHVSVCASFYPDNDSGVVLISDAETCHGYYECNSKHFVGKWRSCPHGTHFQWWSQRCVRPESYSCPYDRCGNLNATFVAAINTGCSEYIQCNNQISHNIIKCSEAYPYFDERRSVCSKDFPNYTVCYMED
ncbi:peritrophin-44 [Drosophila hydei]|uniref:Peritrophin-44 n=1 Tax=Drosophila hydei TaxID=7224 RepID=A0A6J1LVW8_DROHY|nr:peritrophin-44 [Drosophila hydei]